MFTIQQGMIINKNHLNLEPNETEQAVDTF